MKENFSQNKGFGIVFNELWNPSVYDNVKVNLNKFPFCLHYIK